MLMFQFIPKVFRQKCFLAHPWHTMFLWTSFCVWGIGILEHVWLLREILMLQHTKTFLIIVLLPLWQHGPHMSVTVRCPCAFGQIVLSNFTQEYTECVYPNNIDTFFFFFNKYSFSSQIVLSILQSSLNLQAHIPVSSYADLLTFSFT